MTGPGDTHSVIDLAAVEQLHARLQLLATTADPARVASLSTELLETLRQMQQGISSMRDDSVVALHASGRSLNDIARGTGLTRGRVFQIVQRGRDGSVSTPLA